MKPGDKYNMLTAIEKTDVRNGKSYWNFRCDCGNIKNASASNVTTGHVMSCGCLAKKRAAENGIKSLDDLTGKKFGKLTAIRYSAELKKWECKCECGNTCFVAQGNLCRKTDKATKSCGCLVSLDAANEANFVDGTNAGNVVNRTALSNSKTGVRGVYFTKGVYVSTIYFQGKRYYLGQSTDLEKMIRIRKAAEQIVYGDFLEWYEKYREELQLNRKKNKKEKTTLA